MTSADFVRFASRALYQNRRRSALSLVGVVIGVIAVVSLTAIGEGALRYVNDQFASLGNGIVMVVPGKNDTTGDMPLGMGGVPNDLTVDDAIAIQRRVLDIRTAVPMTVTTAAVSHRQRSRQVTIVGATSEFARLQRLELALGSFLPEGDLDRGASVAVLGHTVARELFGHENPLGSTVRVGEWRVRVIGVTARRGTQLGLEVDETVFIPTATGMRMANKSSLTRIMLQLQPLADPDVAIRRVVALLTERHDEEDVTCISQDAVVDSLGSILRVLSLAVAGIAAVSLAVAGIGIMNVMLVTVSERREEVGLLKALGATRRQILLIFLLEAALLSLAGGLLGLGLGTGAVAIGDALVPAVSIEAPAWAAGAVVTLALVTGVVFGVLPAWRASELDPVAALQGH
ncbi:MAG: ABC transporter permease [Deltaproteobacteria bacterium]|nr:ABC transporter permease [Deltaproteobacteria bacterium]